MINLFLKSKHWQLFLVTTGIPIVIQFITISVFISRVGNGSHVDPLSVNSIFSAFTVIMLLSTGVLLGWMYSLATGLQKKLPEGVTMKVNRFRIFFFIPVLYFIVFFVFFNSLGHGFRPNPFLFIFIVPLHLFSMFCMFYTLYFVSKTLKTVELQRAVSFSDYAAEFFLIWFFPVGIWIIQPKINKIIKGETTASPFYSN